MFEIQLVVDLNGEFLWIPKLEMDFQLIQGRIYMVEIHGGFLRWEMTKKSQWVSRRKWSDLGTTIVDIVENLHVPAMPQTHTQCICTTSGFL